MLHFIATGFQILPVLSTVIALLTLALAGGIAIGTWAFVGCAIRDARVARVARAAMADAARTEAVTAWGKLVASEVRS